MRAPTSSVTRPYRRALGQHGVQHRAQRREPDPARDDHQVVARGGLHVPARTERPADPDHAARRGVRAARGSPRRPRAPCATSRRARPSPGSTTPLTEIGTSPMPYAVSMANWPGRERRQRAAVVLQLQRDGVGGVDPAVTRPGTGAGTASGDARPRARGHRQLARPGPRRGRAVQVQQPQPGGLQPLGR